MKIKHSPFFFPMLAVSRWTAADRVCVAATEAMVGVAPIAEDP